MHLYENWKKFEYEDTNAFSTDEIKRIRVCKQHHINGIKMM